MADVEMKQEPAEEGGVVAEKKEKKRFEVSEGRRIGVTRRGEV